jgi:hypothetical protein
MTDDPKSLVPAAAEFFLYSAPDGAVNVRVLFKDETAWLPQRALAELFGVKVPAITKHLKNVFESGVLARDATVSKMEIVQREGGREVAREVEETRRLAGGQKPKALTPSSMSKKGRRR